MNKSVQAAVGGVCAALSVAVMLCSGIFYVFTYAVPMILGLVMMFLKRTFSSSCAWCVYIAVSILSIILVPDKESVLMYTLFFGYYPIIKSNIDKIKFKLIRNIVKLLIYNLAVAAVECIAYFIFGIPFFEDGNFSAAMIILFTVLMNVTFVLYEFLLKNFMILYERKLEKRILKIFK